MVPELARDVGLPPFSDPWDPYHPISSLKKLHSWDEFNKSNFGAKKKRPPKAPSM